MSVADFFRRWSRSIRENVAVKAVAVTTGRIAEDARINAEWSSKIPGAISVSPVTVEGDKVSSTITVDLDIAPEAAAFEFGSGIHGAEGSTYVIAPKNVSMLAFFWDKVDDATPFGQKFRGFLPDGRALFTFVDHPGVAARPYLMPAVNKNMASFLARFTRLIAEDLQINFGVVVSK